MASFGSPLSWWPAFDHTSDAPALGYLGFSGCMSGGADLGLFKPSAPAAVESDRAAAAVAGGGVLTMAPCKAGAVGQDWKLSAEGGTTAVCSTGANSCMFENQGNQKCLQIRCEMMNFYLKTRKSVSKSHKNEEFSRGIVYLQPLRDN